jgi:ABC-type sugar transport system substrate-binding protein
MGMRTSWRRALALAGCVGLVVAACGDDDDDDDTSSGTEPVAETTAPGATGATSDSAATGDTGGSGDAADAAAFVAQYTQRPTAIAVDAPVDAEIPTGLEVTWIQCPVPACVQLEQPLREAAETLGWELTTVQHEGTPESVKAAYEQAVRDEPDAVVSSGFPRVIFDEELAQLAALDIPVVQITVTDPPGDGITAVVNGPGRNARVGEQLANFVAADSGGTANAVWVTTGFPILVPEFEGDGGSGGFGPTLAAVCPDCSVSQLDVPIEALGVDAPARIVAHLQANPDVDYVVGAFGDIVGGLPGALADAGLADGVTIVTYTQNPALSAALEQGEVAAVVGFPGPENMWQAADVLARHFAGVDFETQYDDLPSWIITADNVPSTTDEFPLVEDYQDQYRALWGVG